MADSRRRSQRRARALRRARCRRRLRGHRRTGRSLYVLKSADSLSHRLVGCVEVLCDAADGVATLDGEEDLGRRVVEHFVHLMITNNQVTVKRITRISILLTLSSSLLRGPQITVLVEVGSEKRTHREQRTERMERLLRINAFGECGIRAFFGVTNGMSVTKISIGTNAFHSMTRTNDGF